MHRAIDLIALVLLITPPAFADPSQHQNLGKNHLALQGFDPISYFESGSAKEGNTSFTAEYQSAIYRFESEAHRQTFAANPAKFAPAYGGWCATAMADGKKVEIDPKSFKITNGRLFLFYKSIFADARNKWLKDEPNQTTKADANWKKLVGE